MDEFTFEALKEAQQLPLIKLFKSFVTALGQGLIMPVSATLSVLLYHNLKAADSKNYESGS